MTTVSNLLKTKKKNKNAEDAMGTNLQSIQLHIGIAVGESLNHRGHGIFRSVG